MARPVTLDECGEETRAAIAWLEGVPGLAARIARRTAPGNLAAALDTEARAMLELEGGPFAELVGVALSRVDWPAVASWSKEGEAS